MVAGDVDLETIARTLEKRLADWTGPPRDRPRIPADDLPSARRILLLHRPGAAQAVLRVGHIGITRNDPDFEPATLVNQILGGQFTSRLNEKLREEKGYTYGVRSHFDCRLGRGPFSITTSVQSDKAALALDDIYHELRTLIGSRPPTQSELDNARRALVEGQTRQFETPAALVNRYAHLFIHGLRPDYFLDFPDRLSRIDLDALNTTLHRQFHPEAIVAVVVANADDVIEPLKRLEWAELEILQD